MSDRYACITGAASGIGLATARRLLADGFYVCLADIRAIAIGTLLDAEVRHRAFSAVLDVTREPAWEALAAALASRWGRLDVLVNCAGITGIDSSQNPAALSLDTWRRVMAVNVEGAVIGCRAMLPLLGRSACASIVNVSSLAGRLAVPGACAYAASKAALSSYSRSLALYCAALSPPIRVNTIAPGAIDTPMWDDYLGEGPCRDERYREVAADVPCGRFGAADEVAACVAFLVSEQAGYIAGIELVLDGGQSLKGG